MVDMSIKFVGDFKKLIPMGFEFHKLFARNYKVYSKNDVWVWVAHGGYVEIRDLFDKSKYIAKAIFNSTYPVYEEDKNYNNIIFFKKGKPKGCILNKKTGEILVYRDFYRIHGRDYDYEVYEELLISKDTFDAVKEIENMVEIT